MRWKRRAPELVRRNPSRCNMVPIRPERFTAAPAGPMSSPGGPTSPRTPTGKGHGGDKHHSHHHKDEEHGCVCGAGEGIARAPVSIAGGLRRTHGHSAVPDLKLAAPAGTDVSKDPHELKVT